jgi:hypothetical protein
MLACTALIVIGVRQAASSSPGNIDVCLHMLHALAVSSLSASAQASRSHSDSSRAVIAALQTAVIGVFRHSRTFTFEWLADSLSSSRADVSEESCAPEDAALSPSLFVAQNRRKVEHGVALRSESACAQGGVQRAEGQPAAGRSKGDVALVFLSSLINCMIPIQVEPGWCVVW